MMNRCYTITNKDYPAVGGKGIKVCDRWYNNYENFLDDMGEKPENSIFARHDEDSDFTIHNCYWQPKVNSRTNELYGIWKGVKRRCGVIGKDKNHAPSYSIRGVKMDKDWEESFATFAKDVGARPSNKHQLDRIDNNSGYYPDNIRWVLPEENANNRVDNVFIEFDGKRKTLSQWAREYDLQIPTLYGRFVRLFEPVTKQKHTRCEQINPITGEIINKFNSVKEAAEKTFIKQGTIAKCLCGGNATAGGFAWRYQE